MIKQVTSKAIAMKSNNDGGETDVLMRSKEEKVLRVDRCETSVLFMPVIYGTSFYYDSANKLSAFCYLTITYFIFFLQLNSYKHNIKKTLNNNNKLFPFYLFF